MGITNHNVLMDSYEKLAEKYSFLVDKLKIIVIAVNQTEVNVKELQNIISNIINEMTLKFPI